MLTQFGHIQLSMVEGPGACRADDQEPKRLSFGQFMHVQF